MKNMKHIVRPYLTTHSIRPENQETPISFINSDIINQQLFYRRNHFSYPLIPLSNYWLPIIGSVKARRVLSLHQIMQFPAKILKIVLECSGDKRSLIEPNVFGEQWEKGAISQGYWKGVPLRYLLELSGIKDDAVEVVIEGYDYGKRADLDQVYTYARSLPLEKALHSDTIIAYEYNNHPIPYKHGFPLRLIVPQWYAMASVKWIKQITIVNKKFDGPFQSIDYVYYPNKEDNHGSFPVTTMNVNSTIQKPLHMDILNPGSHFIKGFAWTGEGTIVKVEISTDNGQTWNNVKLQTPLDQNYGWVSWTYEWKIVDRGEYTIMSKATDSQGRVQPMSPFWNRKGYGYNAMDQVKVKIE